MAYATYSRGYKGPTFDGTSATPVNKEIAKSIEVGLKSTWLDRRLRVNVALFNTDFDGYQAQVQNPDVVGQFITLNAGQLRTRGVRARGQCLTGGRPVPEWWPHFQ